MVALVDRLRKVIGDVADPPVFDDDELQAALDERRTVVTAGPLVGDPLPAGDPTVFRAPYGFWETDAVLATSSGGVLTPSGSATDPLVGLWEFTAAPGVGVYLTGRAYDLWGTAANLLEEWAARVAREFDFATDQQTFRRTGKREGLLAVAREYGRRAVIPGTRGWGT
jgi:hypothetical protein